jgi:hypothetical protein
MIETVKGGRNEKELAAKLDGFYLRRAQQDVGITEPVFEMLPVHIDGANIALGDADSAAILAAAEAGDTRTLDMHLGPLRRLTGQLKVPAIVELVKDELGNGPGKLVLMAWHTDVIEALFEGLGRYRPAIVHGSTTPQQRAAAAEAFQSDPACRVFIGQVQAAGEAIDLSAASELVFAEMSFVPAHMAQAAARICNHSQIEQPRVRVAALEGSIDEALAEILLRKVASIKQVIGR